MLIAVHSTYCHPSLSPPAANRNRLTPPGVLVCPNTFTWDSIGFTGERSGTCHAAALPFPILPLYSQSHLSSGRAASSITFILPYTIGRLKPTHHNLNTIIQEIQQPAFSMSTLQDMNSYLWKECPEEFLKLPTTDQFTFVDTPQQLVSGDTGDKLPEHLCGFQLRLGLSDGAYTTGKVVYICLGGRGHNEVLLSCEAKLFKFTLDNLANVLLDEPFRKLLGSETDAEVLNTNEKGRLKAWACYLFLSAGHVPTLPQYPRSQDDLRHACTWIVREYGVKVRTARQKAAVQRKKEKAAKSRVSEQIRSDSSADGYNYEGFADFRSRATTSGTRDQSTNTAEESRVSGFKRENDDDESDNTHSRRCSGICVTHPSY